MTWTLCARCGKAAHPVNGLLVDGQRIVHRACSEAFALPADGDEAAHPETWWNGEPAQACRVRVVVGPAPVRTWWCADLVGQERAAVEVLYGSERFYLDDEDGTGWAKVTEGHGSPSWPHRGLPSRSTPVDGPPGRL